MLGRHQKKRNRNREKGKIRKTARDTSRQQIQRDGDQGKGGKAPGGGKEVSSRDAHGRLEKTTPRSRCETSNSEKNTTRVTEVEKNTVGKALQEANEPTRGIILNVELPPQRVITEGSGKSQNCKLKRKETTKTRPRGAHGL